MSKKDFPTEEKPIELPEKWKSLPLADMVNKGWRPRIKRDRGGHEYITFRFGNQERSLGPFTQGRWDLLMEMFPQFRKVPAIQVIPKRRKGKEAPFLRVTHKKGIAIPKSFVPSLTTLRYFEILKEKKYPGSFDDFINEVVETHFTKCHGIILPVVYEQRGKPIGN